MKPKIITLNRTDLSDYNKNLSIEEIKLSDFKIKSLTREEIRNAELITFIDLEEKKILKNRN